MPRKWRLNIGKRAKALGWVRLFKLSFFLDCKRSFKLQKVLHENNSGQPVSSFLVVLICAGARQESSRGGGGVIWGVGRREDR